MTSSVAALCAVLCASLIANGCGMPRTFTTKSPPPNAIENDPAINHAVRNELVRDPTVSAEDVRVTTRRRVVTLAGQVPNLIAKRNAERIAVSVRYVDAVVNLLDVARRPNRTDEQLARDAEQALALDPSTAGSVLSVSVVDGRATVAGTVGSSTEAQLAETVLASVDGITNIDSEMRIEPNAARTDESLRREIEARLRWDALVDGDLLRVSVQAGFVSLAGVVGTPEQRQRAIADAWVRGVKDVSADDLRLELWARDPYRADRSAPPTQRELEGAVRLALAHDPRVPVAAVQVSAAGDMIVLRGDLPTATAKQAAAEDAAATVGVRLVDNRIVVLGEEH